MRHTLFNHLNTIHSGVRQRTNAIRSSMDKAFGADAMYSQMGGFQSTGMAAAQAMGPTFVSKYQPITVETQEIDPRLHAAQLGWELERRSA